MGTCQAKLHAADPSCCCMHENVGLNCIQGQSLQHCTFYPPSYASFIGQCCSFFAEAYCFSPPNSLQVQHLLISTGSGCKIEHHSGAVVSKMEKSNLGRPMGSLIDPYT